MGFEIKKSMLAKGFTLFLILSLAVMMGILLWTTETETWVQLRHFQLVFIPVLLGLAALRWAVDGEVFVVMTRSLPSRLRLKRAVEIRLEGSLVANVVPVLLGAFSMHAYLLHKEKLSLSESVAITVLRAVLPIFLFLLNIPILFILRSDPTRDLFFHRFLQVISLPLVIVILFFIYTLFYPAKIKRAASALIRWWGRIRFVHVERILAWEERMFHEIDQFSIILWSYIRTRKAVIAHSMAWLLAAFVVDYIIALAICWGFGVNPPLVRGILLQCLMRPIIYLAPTPGGAGIWDFTYLGFFSLYLPQPVIGISVLLWRLLISYLPAIAGAFVLVSEFRRDRKLKQILVERGVLSEKDLQNGNPS